MTNTSTGDISRLPQWAQRKIQNQEREIERLREVTTVQESIISGRGASDDIDTDVWIQRFEPGDVALPKGSTILFGNREHHFTAELLDTGELAVRSSWGPVDIRPEASNSIRVALRERLRR